MSRVVVITGASSGVGRAIAERFAARGDFVIGFARSQERLDALEVALTPERFRGVAVDVRRSADVHAAFTAIAALRPTVDLLVNNAAIFKMAAFETFTGDEIDAILDTNLKGTIHCTHAALTLMRRGARIVNISSVSGTHGIANQAAYSASKFGLEGFADALGQELLPRGIFLTTICPGGIATPLWNESNPYPGDVDRLLQSSDIVDLVEHIADLPPRVVFKKAILFPSNEWH